MARRFCPAKLMPEECVVAALSNGFADLTKRADVRRWVRIRGLLGRGLIGPGEGLKVRPVNLGHNLDRGQPRYRRVWTSRFIRLQSHRRVLISRFFTSFSSRFFRSFVSRFFTSFGGRDPDGIRGGVERRFDVRLSLRRSPAENQRFCDHCGNKHPENSTVHGTSLNGTAPRSPNGYTVIISPRREAPLGPSGPKRRATGPRRGRRKSAALCARSSHRA